MDLSFHGAARNVTGSCYLIEAAGKRILIDCGLYQGGRELHEENAELFGFDPATIDTLLLTHAHLDHCGRIPLLVKGGFTGEIVCTAATRELARLVLLDAAHIQEEEARYRARKEARRGDHGGAERPLYTLLDALACLDAFRRVAAYGQEVALAPGIRATFLDAGHILGSASIVLDLDEGGSRHRLCFSGDLGNGGRPLLRDPTPPAAAETVVMETTYGDRCHKPLEPSVEELWQAITDTFERGGNVIIPTFALERAQELLYYLRQGMEQRRLPHTLQLYLNSPMAISATEIFKRHPDGYNEATRALFQNHSDPFDLPGLHFTRDMNESIALNQIRGGAVILAGAGMCSGGRIRHHLKHNLWRRESTILFVGYAARGTLARQIIDGAKTVRIFGEEIPVRATIQTINGFSAHADRDELRAWHQQIQGVARTFLVHGDEEAMARFAHLLPANTVEMPRLHQRYTL